MRRVSVADRVTSARAPNARHRDGSFAGLSSRGCDNGLSHRGGAKQIYGVGTVNLPSAAGEIVPAAGGRLLLIHLPKERKLAVFDTVQAKVLKYLPVAEDDA